MSVCTYITQQQMDGLVCTAYQHKPEDHEEDGEQKMTAAWDLFVSSGVSVEKEATPMN